MLSAGLHITNPFARTSIFSTKTQLFEQQNHVPTKEGLTVDLDVAVIFGEKDIGGSGGSLEPPGPLLTHLIPFIWRILSAFLLA